MQSVISRLLVVLLTLALTLAGVAEDVPTPDWDSDIPFTINGLRVGMTSSELSTRVGEPVRQLNESMALYSGNLLVRTRDEEVVNLAATDEHGQWTLGQGGQDLASTGIAVVNLEGRFGDPAVRFVREGDVPLSVGVYRAMLADVGVMVAAQQVVGFLLSEPGLMEPTLQAAGYATQEP